MASLIQFKRRIASTSSLAKIFKAQELIAASRIAHARELKENSEYYADSISRAVISLATHADINHPMTRERKEIKNAGILVVCSDRGMAGAYSSTLIRETEKLKRELQEKGLNVELYVSGKRGESYYKFRDIPLAGVWTGKSDMPNAERANEIGKKLVTDYLSEDPETRIDQLYIVCMKFVNTVKQHPRIIRMLPLKLETVTLDENGNVKDTATGKAHNPPPTYEFEPSVEDVLDAIFPRYVSSRLHECMLESALCETASRQQAMHTANDNASELVDDLVRKLNKARQAVITNELTEIVSSADALKEDKH
ncbi:MAG: F0F1 ATP synthase subunit gamma [Bifidobacteriaceae bacterium]|jgi:F-type H+-transporting ATPase subunit gamma|nr:F0F1 ATP synthase subunit gamma [Bifidobacteriaceae bacterium]